MLSFTLSSSYSRRDTTDAAPIRSRPFVKYSYRWFNGRFCREQRRYNIDLEYATYHEVSPCYVVSIKVF